MQVEAARRVIHSGRTIADAARDMDISETLLGRWVAHERRRNEAAAPSGDQPPPQLRSVSNLCGCAGMCQCRRKISLSYVRSLRSLSYDRATKLSFSRTNPDVAPNWWPVVWRAAPHTLSRAIRL